ncbi:MAG: hypothetical protein IPG84_09530 [Betaproteobacteria bacterium]|nr:hypothetical protein [Betaproteobacteria bacterium]
MIARRTLRRLVALAATLAIVGAHTAAAAYACARGSDGLPFPAAAAAPCVEHMIDGAGPADGDGNANLCEVHCQDGSVPVPAAPVLRSAAGGRAHRGRLARRGAGDAGVRPRREGRGAPGAFPVLPPPALSLR